MAIRLNQLNSKGAAYKLQLNIGYLNGNKNEELICDIWDQTNQGIIEVSIHRWGDLRSAYCFKLRLEALKVSMRIVLQRNTNLRANSETNSWF